MKHISFSEYYDHNDQVWHVNAIPSGLYTNMLNSIFNQLEGMLSHHNKILCVRMELRQDKYTEDNEQMTVFNHRFVAWLKKEYILSRVGYIWCREHEGSDKQHYHYALVIDANKVSHPSAIIEQAQWLWADISGHLFVPKNCYHIVHRDKRGINFDEMQEVIWRLSYLAKAKGKDKKPTYTHSYGTSNIKLNEFKVPPIYFKNASSVP